MALPSSGTITLAQIQTEFGGANPIGLNEYYKGGAYVTTSDNAPNVPTSGTISLSNFWGASKNTFTPVLRTYTSGTAVTETAPTGASNVLIAVWGGGGGGGGGYDDSEFGYPVNGCGGGGGAYCESSYSISGGQTLTYTVGFGGNGGLFGGSSGTLSSVSSGTRAITTMTANPGQGGTRVQVGLGGTASGGTTTNTSGNDGSIDGTGADGILGFNSVSAGAGGDAGFGQGDAGLPGEVGTVIFYYT